MGDKVWGEEGLCAMMHPGGHVLLPFCSLDLYAQSYTPGLVDFALYGNGL